MNRRLVLVVSLFLVAGCGPSVPRGVIVKGKVTKGGAPLKLEGQSDASPTSIDLTLVSTTPNPDGSSSGSQGQLDANGEFRFAAAGKGVPPGKYQILMTGNSGPGGDAFGGAFNPPNFLKEFEVPADKVGGEFDVGTIEIDDLPPRAATPQSDTQ